MPWTPLISITRDGTKSVARIDTRLSIERHVFLFNHEMGSEGAAQLLTDHLQALIHREIEKARSEAYMDGYRDGRGKQAKRDHFNGYLGRDT